MVLSRPGRSGGDEPGFEAIGGCVHKRRALNTRLSSGTSAGTFVCPAGPYTKCWDEAGTKNEPKWYFVPVQKKGSESWSSRFEPKISLISFSGGSGPPKPKQTNKPSRPDKTYLRIRSSSTVDKDSSTWKYGRYLIDRRFHPKIGRNRTSIWIHTKKKSVDIDRRCALIPKKNRLTVDGSSKPKQTNPLPVFNKNSTLKQTNKSISTVEVDMDSKELWLPHYPYFITNRCKWLTRTLTSFHGDQFQALLTKQHTRKKQTHTNKV